MAVKVIVCGALGRMGRRIISLALEDKEVEVVGGVEHPECIKEGDLGKALKERRLEGVPLTSRLEEVLERGEVVIEFTGNPQASLGYASLTTSEGKGIVIGTTGFTEAEVEKLKEFSKDGAVLLSPNMSLGVNLLFKLVEMAWKVLRDKGFDVEIVEMHHRFKKDSPSGTALKLFEVLGDERLKPTFGREGLSKRKEEEVGIFALRGGDVVGEHTVYFIGLGERIEISHRALSRDIFARGALLAGKFLKGKGRGFYSMLDVLGLK